MVISNIIGGLGNQMFQYAAGRSLAEKYGDFTCLDVRQFPKYKLHNGFELHRVFTIDSPIASFEEIKNLIGWRSYRIGHRLVSCKHLSFLRGNHFYIENAFPYDDNFFSLPNNIYISGYWQSYRYFLTHQSIIRNQFKFKPIIQGLNREIADRIINCNAVSLHFRRGDYVSNHRTNSIHGTCSTKYYYSAMHYIQNHIKKPVYFIFSDDIDWVKRNFSIGREYYFIYHNTGTESYNDMRLMSMCNHHIIANSSFSWWGAWLNPIRDKIVIAPYRWFNDPSKSTHSLTPPTWIKL